MNERSSVRLNLVDGHWDVDVFLNRPAPDYISKYGCAPAEADIQRHFLVSAPTVNQMMQRLERLGLIARTPGQARSIRLRVAPEWLPRS